MKNETTLDYVQRMLQETKGQWKIISAKSGLGYSWLTKLAEGWIPNPGIKRVEKLAAYFRSRKKASA